MNNRGSILLLVLVFGSVFFIILAALADSVLAENRYQNMLIAKATSFSIAEAGLEHYAWFLSRYPTDLQHGTGQPGPYVIPYADVSGKQIGTFELSVSGVSACGSMQSVDITSKGVATGQSSFYSTLIGRFGSPSVALYSKIVSADGTTHGVDFSTLTPNFASLKTFAQSYGTYLPRISPDQPPYLGYHLIFKSDGTVTISKVTGVAYLQSVVPADKSKVNINDYTLITAESPLQTIALNSGCSFIFVEDNAWIEGTIPQNVTLVAANLTGKGISADIVLRNNITSVRTNGSAGITVIAQRNILIAPDSPMDMSLNGIFVATQGVFGRNNYMNPSKICTVYYETRGTLTVTGTIISKLAPIVRWTNGCAVGKDAGYQTWNMASDPALAANPPPFTPVISTTKQFISWKQIR
jgi:hypothetical protein